MVAATFLSVLLAAIVALGLALFQYYFKEPARNRSTWGLILLRFCSLFILFLLILNPEIKTTSYYSEKSNLVLLIDNSASIGLTEQGDSIKVFLDEIKKDPSITENFEIKEFSFGGKLETNDSLTFDEPETNLAEAFSSLDKVYKNSLSPTIVITDGNQTYGEDFLLSASRYSNAILPVIVGDTTSYRDLSISQVNVNRYSFLGNNFPVEVFVNYSGKEEVNARLEIHQENSRLYSSTINLDRNTNSRVVEILLPSEEIGPKNYAARLVPVEGEKNTLNNSREFVVEGVDERATVLILTEVMHPDLGALKRAVESNQQREVEIRGVSKAPLDYSAYEVVILYQPTNNFQGVFHQLEQEKKGYGVITGTASNWNIINSNQHFFRKEPSSVTEEFFPEINPDFGEFQVEDLGFSSFPPLSDVFGELETNSLKPILLGKVQGMSTEASLLAIAEEDDRKYAFLFGEGLWKWRSRVFRDNQSHQAFNDFLGGIVQFLAPEEHMERLMLNYEASYMGRERKLFQAYYYNRNFEFDNNAKLELNVKDKNSQESHLFPMILKDGRYEVELGMLEPSEYRFTVSSAGENLQKSGEFKIEEDRLEQQFPSANLDGLLILADQHDRPLFFLKDSKKLRSALLSENTFIPVQKSRENIVPLVDWYYLLFFFILTASSEWFIRKYRGLI